MICDQCIPSMTIFMHDKLMATYKKLTPSLCFLPLFNCSQLSFAMCLKKNTLRICWYIRKISIESSHTCLNIAKVGIFSKSMDKSLPCFYTYSYCKIVVNLSKNSSTLFTHLWTLHSIYHHFFFTHDKWMVAYLIY